MIVIVVALMIIAMLFVVLMFKNHFFIGSIAIVSGMYMIVAHPYAEVFLKYSVLTVLLSILLIIKKDRKEVRLQEARDREYTYVSPHRYSFDKLLQKIEEDDFDTYEDDF